MTRPLKIVRSLDALSTGYTVFEKDQVLTEKQLNGITDYLDDQDRLTRIELLGTGIIGGLRVMLAGDKVMVSRGVGVTTDGDLLALQSDTAFDRFRYYDEKAPVYPPFYPGSREGGKMMQIFELVRATDKDTSALDMSTLPVRLGDSVVILFMESYRNDPDLCSGTDCDNLGQEIINTARFLLVARRDAAGLLNALTTNSVISLPEISANRPLTGGAIASTDGLGRLYRDACNNIHASLINNFSLFFNKLQNLIRHPFDTDPSPDWVATLNARHTRFAVQDAGIQYYYDFLKDLAETWNALRDVLFEDDSVLCPDINAFPKHLLLGSLDHPLDLRTGLYPSPLTGNRVREHAHFLVSKLHTLINTFEPPRDSTITVTPGNDESVPLEDRAIPCYYAFNSAHPIHLYWNYHLTMRGLATHNLGYRAAAYGGSAVALNPLSYQIGRYNFFRIEGHIGQNVAEAQKKIEQTIRNYNLPFCVRAVLLHTDRKHIALRPPIRYGDLHRFHQLLRKDVATQLSDGKTFNQSFRDGINDAVTRNKIPATLPWLTATEDTNTIAQSHYQAVEMTIAQASIPLHATRYSEYRKALAADHGQLTYKDTLVAASTFKLNFGAMVRSEFSTPFDSLMTSNHSLWLDWLDDLIDHRDAIEDDKLLFSNFISSHPGLEHAGGVTRGGTFVLVYDDQASVVADFMLPYYAAENRDDEPDEPVLTLKPRKPDVAIKGGFTLVQPIDAIFTRKLNDFKAQIQPEWQKEINIQKDHMAFFRESVDALSKLTNARVNMDNIADKFTDKMLEYHIDDVRTKTRQVADLRQIVMDQQLSGDAREQAGKKLEEMQVTLADSIAEGTRYVIDGKIDVAGTADGGRALNTLSQSVGMVAEGAARTRLGNKLSEIKGAADGAQAAALVGLLKVGGFR